MHQLHLAQVHNERRLYTHQHNNSTPTYVSQIASVNILHIDYTQYYYSDHRRVIQNTPSQ